LETCRVITIEDFKVRFVSAFPMCLPMPREASSCAPRASTPPTRMSSEIGLKPRPLLAVQSGAAGKFSQQPASHPAKQYLELIQEYNRRLAMS